jgi:serine/threonine-protein kinase
MSVVWRAWDEVLDRHVAVKLLSPRFVADPAFRQRIRAEAQAAARLAHANIAGIYDYGESLRPGGARVPYIVMELLSGQTLAEVLDDGPLPLAKVLRICAQIAGGLAAAHEEGIVHRDVKPANVMVTANGTAKVVDFGVSAVVGDLTEQGGVLFGTPAYVAPERLSGGAVVAGTDVYGLGVLLYRMLAGYMPWSAESTTQMLVAHMYHEPEPLPPLIGLPPDVIAICESCLHKNPGERPAAADVAEILSAAGRLVSDEITLVPIVAPDERRPAERPKRRRAPRPRHLVMASGALAVVVAAAVIAANTGSAADEPTTAGPGGRTDVPTAAQPTSSAGTVGAGMGSGTAPPGGTAQDGTAPGPAGLPPVADTGQPVVPEQPGPTNTTYNQPGNGQNGTPDPQWQERSASEYGNSVTVRCTGAVAKVVGYQQAEGWSATRVNPGPAEQVNIRFESATVSPGRVTFKSRCKDGVPRINPDVAAP